MIGQSVRYKATIEELEPIEMLIFPQAKIEELAKINPEIYKWLYHSTHKTQQAWIRAQISTLYDKETRIVSSLLEIAKYIPNIKGSFQKIHASQRQLSLITGISRPRLNETLKELEVSKEISLERGVIHLLKPDALRKRMERVSQNMSGHE
ncbi:Crp/Fnr family transcriptional regulator [Vibrio mexicanus]|uniref:Crp/Fnr family transcriptional regulator n=1 Tax=Vibrio mexicanus TaxID=1004326 RepID=UPI00069CB384|nr:helix-turn-helix domain-containing protein [Vibrio mexicanus]